VAVLCGGISTDFVIDVFDYIPLNPSLVFGAFDCIGEQITTRGARAGFTEQCASK
jgi:hypothetical protein